MRSNSSREELLFSNIVLITDIFNNHIKHMGKRHENFRFILRNLPEHKKTKNIFYFVFSFMHEYKENLH